MTVGIYMLSVEKRRRQGLLDDVDQKGKCTEGVPKFQYSRHNHLLVILSFQKGMITHIADGHKTYNNLSDSVSLVMTNIEKLKKSIEFETLLNEIEPKLMPYLRNRIISGGLLGAKTRAAVVEILAALLGLSIVRRLNRLSPGRSQYISDLSDRERENLSIQKNGLGTVFRLAGFSVKDIPLWGDMPKDDEECFSYLDGLEDTPKVEDPYDGPIMEEDYIHSDFENIPGFVRETYNIKHRTFIKIGNPKIRLRVLMANRYALETQTGADLIYHNETQNNFVFVQYKVIDKDGFRWPEKGKFSKQIDSMSEIIDALKIVESENTADNHRFTDNPYFLKFLPRHKFTPDDSGLAKGYYLPLDYWKKACADRKFKGPRGGNVLKIEDIDRYISDSDFRSLVSNSWIGTSIEQSRALEGLIKKIMKDNKTVIYASLSEFS